MKKYLFLAVASMSLYACNKKDQSATCDNTVAAIAGSYKVTSITFAGQSAWDLYYSDNCLKDDIYVLKADKTLDYNDSGTICSSNSTGSGTWDVVSGRITITHTGDGPDFDGTVKNKCNTIEISETFNGQSFVVTLTKQ